MKLTVCFMTGRKDPRLDWVVEDLIIQSQPDDQIELVVIDFYNRLASDLAPIGLLNHPLFTNIVVAPPMPNIWQGQYRVTSADFWATATARNTALVMASTDFVAFLDDRCHLGPKWLDTVRRYELERDAVLLGSYDKYEDGNITSKDHRRELFPDGKKNCLPGWLYGCTFACPLDWLLEVNGFEAGADSLTGEDYLCGMVLGNVDRRLDFMPDMFVKQDRTSGNVSCKGIFVCRDKGVSPNDKSHAALERFGKRTRTEFTPDLRKLRIERDAAHSNMLPWSFPVPDPTREYRDWFDDELINGLR
jgi:hypothetical protein